MTLHLVKLCVGIQSAQELKDRYAASIARYGAGGFSVGHTTRMYPSRADEIVGKGSLFWIVKGQICIRQAILGISQFKDPAGVSRCRIQLSSELVDVQPRPKRPFQGWRYLTEADAPPDLGAGVSAAVAEMPEEMKRELATLGLL